jgi:hypothetical protein
MEDEMAEFQLSIDSANDAFAENPYGEVARILRNVADRVDQGEEASHYKNVIDFNGNVVGRFRFILDTDNTLGG